jgi:hypothetical protein
VTCQRGSLPPPGPGRRLCLDLRGVAQRVGQPAPMLETGPGESVMPGSSFALVLAAAIGGDEQAFATLWRDLRPAVLRCLRVVAPGAVEDVAWQAWVEVARGLGRFTGDEAGFRSWVFIVARRRALDDRRRRARRMSVPLPGELAAEWHAVDDPAGQLVQGLSSGVALALIAQLHTTRPRWCCCGWWPAWALSR